MMAGRRYSLERVTAQISSNPRLVHQSVMESLPAFSAALAIPDLAALIFKENFNGDGRLRPQPEGLGFNRVDTVRRDDHIGPSPPAQR